ncbi:hypothetical protein ACI2LF_08300 [Kribbella sp. NPDC020789]
MTTEIFPVGHYTGVLPSAIGAPNHIVRVGRTQHRLTEADLGSWMLAHGPAGAIGAPWTLRPLLDEAAELGMDGVHDRLAELADRGLVVGIDPADGQVSDVVRAYRLSALMIGLGEVPEEPGRHRIGVPEVGVVAVLDPDSYELWRWAATAPTLWASCELRSAVAGRPDPRTTVGGVLRDLRTVIAHGCGYLDVVR